MNRKFYKNNHPNLCTILTKDYLVKGLALYHSLKKHTKDFHLWVLCVDEVSYDILEHMELKNVTLVKLKNLQTPKLKQLQKTRKLNEFCWTLKAPFILYLIKNNYNLDSIMYIDADLFFFDDIKQLYKEWGQSSILLTKLWLSPAWNRRVGRYQAGLIGFKRDANAFKCLNWWNKKCLEWCFDIKEKKRWADQKYLDKWPALVSDIKIIKSLGINSGPWNVRRFPIRVKGDVIYCKSNKLIAYHYSGFDIFNEGEFELCNRKKLPRKAIKHIYGPYAEEISKVIKLLKSKDKEYSYGFSSKHQDKKLYNYYCLESND
ncbi:glycosyltransferase [Proteinivorax hydrogeniformans]|uniref:Glycosyltransferase n=1 Tax=Proteinivorax hydrogeniformans TaxID=1826727 RepID=A0AAU8HV43_9FIRM